jgi:hypothetical protein
LEWMMQSTFESFLLGFVCKHWFCNWVFLWFVIAIDHLHPPQCGFCSVVVPKNKSPAIDRSEESFFPGLRIPLTAVPNPHLLFMTPGKFIFLHCKSHSNTRIYHLQHDPENQ